jgi:hypothetical protein
MVVSVVVVVVRRRRRRSRLMLRQVQRVLRTIVAIVVHDGVLGALQINFAR